MRFIAFQDEAGQPRLGARHDADTLVDLTAAGLPTTLDELLQSGDAALDAARRALDRAATVQPLATLNWLPPVARPSKAIAIGLNYVDHASEARFEPPQHPVIFQRYPSSWVAHGQALVLPRISSQFDYEAEVVVVIGRAGRYIEKKNALQHVAGYSLFNDGSIRDHQFRSHQWLMGKNFDRTGAFGPEFVTADELPPGASGLQLQCRLNGQIVQRASTSDMIFDVATLVAACSEAMMLRPGDLIITGTPAGVGMARQPPLWMKAGDVCEVELEGLAVLRNPVRAED